MLDTNKMPAHVYDALIKRGHHKERILSMTPEEAFEEFCEWHGLRSWGNTLWTSLDGLRAAHTSVVTSSHLENLLTGHEIAQLKTWCESFKETNIYPDMDENIVLRDKLYCIFRNTLALDKATEPYNRILDYMWSWPLATKRSR